MDVLGLGTNAWIKGKNAPGQVHAGGVMHREIEQMIPDFLEDRLDDASLGHFLSHTAGCASCMDELTIQYLVRVGMEKAETGGSFNLERDLEDFLDQQARRLKRRRTLRFLAWGMEITAMFMSAVAVFIGFYYG